MNSYSLPKTFEHDIKEFEQLVERYKDGSISSAELKARRVPFGIYEQREKDTYMLRIRCAGGIVSPAQLAQIARLAERYGRGQMHLTTRQEIQVHNIGLEDFIPLIKVLKEIGMSSRGGGGNTVRNVICPEDAGTDPEEVFDVSPYAIALTTRLIAEEDSWTLPRKFKIAFSGSARDKGYAAVADIGFIAKNSPDGEGFQVYVAGGMGTASRTATLFSDFIRTEDVYNFVKAVKNLFWNHGNRKNKHKARLRFLWKELGEEKFRELFREEYEKVLAEAYPPLELKNKTPKDPSVSTGMLSARTEEKKGFERWRRGYVREQKQEGLFSVTVPIWLGLMGSREARDLAEFLLPLGEDVLRVTTDQNLFIRDIPAELLPDVHGFLKENIKAADDPLVLNRMIACAGASTCQLGLCLSRGLAAAIKNTLERTDIALDKVADLGINISGCPNSCGRHLLAHIGFFGKASRKNEKLYPAYTVVAGYRIQDDGAEFAETLGEISARNVPALLEMFLREYIQRKDKYESFRDYLDDEGREVLLRLIKEYSHVPSFEEDKNYYYDLGAEETFSLASRGLGECSAGIFDLIELDLKNMKRIRKELVAKNELTEKKKHLKDLIFHSARALLITRGEEPKSERDIYAVFKKHFIDSGLVPVDFDKLLRYADKNDLEGIRESELEVYALAECVERLYDEMDNAFNFGAEEQRKKTRNAEENAAEREQARSKVKDLRGVACPMNFVLTKTELAQMEQGELLEVWLDEGEPMENVPGSVREEGHEIVEQQKKGEYWTVLIRKR